LLRF
jgi:josephin